MNKKERAMHVLESELDSIAQGIYCNKECHNCRYLRRIRKLQGAARTVMDYGKAPKNATIQTFNDMRDKRTDKERRVKYTGFNRRVSPGFRNMTLSETGSLESAN